MKRHNPLIYIVGLFLLAAALPASASPGDLDPASVHVQELTFSELFAGLTPENVLILTSVPEFRELVRLATVDKTVSP